MESNYRIETLPNKGLWRAITTPSLRRIFYAIIISLGDATRL